jgi:parvulin-like peptidyl-prolyl isomerase
LLAWVIPLALILASSVPASAAALDSPDTVLVRRGDSAITRADWDAELLRIPSKDRAEFASSPRRDAALLERMLTTRELAVQARQKKLDTDPVTRVRIRQEEEKILAAAWLASVEESAAADFELRRPMFERRAREVYEIDRAKYATPETVMISLVFFAADKAGADAASRRADEALAKIKGGADIGEIAASDSDDTSTREARGRKGPLARTDMDASLANAVFALKAKGEVTGALRTREGFYIVRLDERRPPVQQTFGEAQAAIMAELKQTQVTNARQAAIANLGAGREIEVNDAAIGALRTTPAQNR